ncbi:hypothetical protein KAZ66_01355 [Candidatus Woesebacteria bacterium]|nr:hypothetical protein [Candidatus Woesebacteria bacterium]
MEQDIGSMIIWLTPPVSLILNIVLIFVIMYIIRLRRPSSNDVKSTDQRIATNYREAEFEASELMKDATEKAKRIIQEAGITKESLDARLEKSLGQMTDVLNEKILTKEDEIFKQYKNIFDKIAESYQKEGSTIVTGFKDEGDTMLKTFIQTMHAEINSVREQVFDKIDAKMSLIEEDLKKYRETQQKRLDENIQKITKNTIEMYMKDALAYENHEQILFKVMDRFKKDNQNSNNT